ncbi:hypothetical protein [Meiothermus granaticius]|uniref:Uncharacterized protein n=1 Tax=Meiothermus granaticius NBRC 107808 TaxID=1227551 RepID=A0A399FCT2_9DEIN|nr:hypothetical protein [Meiothermus granaticius]RIH93576.1 hypothetical protein Mgrana_00400 [Meiothermus granaticius NBRC 107808]GEM87214.1 hypothetical protein MGR01S_18390 [Meiothermus granaticius NBRC 107808]
MKRFLLAVIVLGGLSALAQTLVEVTSVAAVSSSLDSGLTLPSGTFRAGKGSEAILARMPDANRFNLEVYTARGLTANLQPAFVQQILTNFTAAGYLLNNQETITVNGETRTRYNLSDESGKPAVLFVVRKGNELVYAFGKAK